MREQGRTILQVLKKGWMTFAFALGWFNTRLLLTIVYVVLIGIPAIVLKVIRKDLLDRRWHDRASYWRIKETVDRTGKHQF